MSANNSPRELGPFQFVILTLSIFVIGALMAETVIDIPREAVRMLRWIDNLVCGVFLVDFVKRFRAAPSKLHFMKWGWIDLIASIPEVQFLRWGRIFRVIRILRIFKQLKSLRALLRAIFVSRTTGGVASVFIITFLVLSLSSIGILLVERTETANIKTAEDALWWSVTTITTVGYGDKYPVTNAGRLIAASLMFSGVGLFGTLSGVIASFFLGDKKPEHTPESNAAHIAMLEEEILRLRKESAGGTPPAPSSSSH